MNAFADTRMVEWTNAPALGEVVRSLAKAERLVSALRDGPMHKAALAEEIGVSKSTVYNWTSELGDLGLVTRTAEGYRLTRVGRLHVEAFLEFGDASGRIYGLEPVLDELPVDLLPPRSLLREGQLVTADSDPDAPMNELLDLLGTAEHVAGLLPLVSSRVVGPLRERLQDGSLSVDLVLTPSAVESLVDGHPGVLELVAASDDSRLLVAEDRFAFGLFRSAADRTRVGVAAYTNHGHLGALVRLHGDAAVDWAETVEATYRADATEVQSVSDAIE